MNAPILILFYFITPDMVAQYEKEEREKHNASMYAAMDAHSFEIEKNNKVIKYCNKELKTAKSEWEKKEFEGVKLEKETRNAELEVFKKELKLLLK